MARPTEFNTITIIQDYVNFLGVISTGTVTFEPPNVFFKAEPSDVAITPKAIIGTLNPQGRLEVVLPFTDDPDITPSFTYHVTENIDGLKRTTDIEVPIDLALAGQPVKLYDLVVVGQPTVVGSNLLTKSAADLLYLKKGEDAGGLSSWAQLEATFSDMPTVFPPEIGPAGDQAVAGNDARLTNERVPVNNSVSTAKLQDNAVTSGKIANGTIVNEDIATAAGINLDKTVDSANRLAMTPAERTKLTTVASGATSNDTDANLRNRATHTGSQAPETISNLLEYIQDAVGNMFTGGNVTVVYDDASGGLSLTAPAGGSTGIADPEGVQDALATALIGVGAISVTYNDQANTFTFATTATQNSTDAFLLNRTNHTGQQAISTITNLQTTLDGKAASVHTHAIADVTNLQTTLDGKAASTHTHTIANVTNLQTVLDTKGVKAEVPARILQNADGSWPARPSGYPVVDWQRTVAGSTTDPAALANDYLLEPK